VAELADAQDLKSWVPQGACGFETRPRHEFPNRRSSDDDPRPNTTYCGKRAAAGESRQARPRWHTPVRLYVRCAFFFLVAASSASDEVNVQSGIPVDRYNPITPIWARPDRHGISHVVDCVPDP
jgi:hypothetical protein